VVAITRIPDMNPSELEFKSCRVFDITNELVERISSGEEEEV
jgi:hypothetical protein